MVEAIAVGMYLLVALRAARRRGMTLDEWCDWNRLVDIARD